MAIKIIVTPLIATAWSSNAEHAYDARCEVIHAAGKLAEQFTENVEIVNPDSPRTPLETIGPKWMVENGWD